MEPILTSLFWARYPIPELAFWYVNLNVTPGQALFSLLSRVDLVWLGLPLLNWFASIITVYVVAGPLLSVIDIVEPLLTVPVLLWLTHISLAVLE